MIDTILIFVLKESLSHVLIMHVTVKNDSLTVLWLKHKRIPEIHLHTLHRPANSKSINLSSPLHSPPNISTCVQRSAATEGNESTDEEGCN